jgi:hypothetical protein
MISYPTQNLAVAMVLTLHQYVTGDKVMHNLDVSVINGPELSVGVTKTSQLIKRSRCVPVKHVDLVTNVLVFNTTLNASPVELHVHQG